MRVVGRAREPGAGAFDQVAVDRARGRRAPAELRAAGRDVVASGASARRRGWPTSVRGRGGRTARMSAMSELANRSPRRGSRPSGRAGAPGGRCPASRSQGASRSRASWAISAENAEYHIATEDQAHLETKIKRLHRAPAQRARGRGAGRQRRRRLRLDRDRRRRGERARGDLDARRPTEADVAQGKLSAESPSPGPDRPPRRRRESQVRTPQRRAPPVGSDPRGQREQVLGERADQRRRARAVVVGHVAPEPADDHRGLARVLVAHQVRRGRGLVGHGDPRSRAARGRAASARPRQSSSAASPAMPIATSHWPWRQARPKESAMTTAGRPGSAGPQARARWRRDRAAAVTTCPRRAALEASTPALAQTKPWRVRQISTPRSARSTAADSSRTTWTCARVLAVPARKLDRARASARPRQAPQRTLGLGHDLVREHEHVAGLAIRRPAAARRGRRPAAPRAARAAPMPADRSPLTPTPVQPREQAARVRRRRRCARRARRAAPSRSSAVSTSSASERRLGDPPARAGRLGRARVARAAARAEARRDGVGRREQQRVGARSPWRSGTTTTSGALIPSRTSSSISRGSSAGQSPGTSSTRSAAALERPVHAGARGVRVAAVVLGDRLRPRSARASASRAAALASPRPPCRRAAARRRRVQDVGRPSPRPARGGCPRSARGRGAAWRRRSA